MAVVRKANNTAKISQKAKQKVTTRSTRQPSTLQEMGDIDFGTLDSTKDNLVVSYNSDTNRFVLVSADEILDTAAETGDINDQFVTQLEQELDLSNIVIEDLDGGTF